MSLSLGYLLYEQLTKYEAKYSGDNVKTVLTLIHETIMVPRYQASVSAVRADIDTAIRILEENGVPTGRFAPCIAFAEKIAREKFSHTGPTLVATANGWKAYFVAQGCPSDIADKIFAALVGAVGYY
jgi:hypothetical protein